MPTGPRPLCVVAAAIVREGRVLIARRPAHVHQGGLWEFPGGKREPGETPESALRRELHEELGIEASASRPLIRIRHAYPDKLVELDVRLILAFAGEPHGREGQAVRWVRPQELPAYRFPDANRPIVMAVRLPDTYLVTGAFADRRDFLRRLDRALEAGVQLVQLRAKALGEADYRSLAMAALDRCRRRGAVLLLNAAPRLVRELGADGIHLDTRRLATCRERPLPEGFWVGASAHKADELARAARIGADFAVLGPVAPTASHPGSPPLGWPAFAERVEGLPLPVYALGGVGPADRERAFRHGAQGIAAIRALWGAEEE